MFVTWTTVDFATEGTVRYGKEGTQVEDFTALPANKTKLVHTEYKSDKTRTTYVFRAEMKNLEPNTNYS